MDEPFDGDELNFETDIHRKFKAFKFPADRRGRKRTGDWWINDRIKEMFSGEYWQAVNRDKQLEYVMNALKKIKTQTWNSNRLFITLFRPSDLHKSIRPIPPCLATVDFKPEKNALHLIASWRAQYVDTKAYGNLISLAMLLDKVCKETRLKRGEIFSIAHKGILKHNLSVARELYAKCMKGNKK